MHKLSLIPTPQRLQEQPGELLWDGALAGTTVLTAPESDDRLCYHARRILGTVQEVAAPGYSLTVGRPKAPPKPPEPRPDAYTLEIETGGLALTADTAAGLFYGMITLEKLLEQFGSGIPCMRILDFSALSLRSDYLDLRSVHPPLPRILGNIPLIAKAKLNALVVEYEDKLPLGDPFTTENLYWHFSPQEFSKFCETCWRWFVEIIPLQQSFGHLEYILKDPRYTHLCETPLAVGDLCPCKAQSLAVAEGLLEGMAALHPKERYLHIGCDEVWSLKSCPQCKNSGKSAAMLFIAFVNRLIEKVCCLGKCPMLWHDMFEHCTSQELAALDKRALVCVWMYNGNDLPWRIDQMVQKLNAAGLQYIACPSVRAWDCDDRQNYPVLTERLPNLRYWHEAIGRHGISGIINTNWAACFALGKPYGVYETSLFPLYFSAEKSWNPSADEGTFLRRFFMDFHGYRQEDPLFQRGYKNEDYFLLLAALAEKLPKAHELAELVAALRAFELPTRRHFPLSVVLYRQEFFNTSDEVGSLLAKYSVVKDTLAEIVPPLTKALEGFLSPEGVKQYLRSRLLVEELILQKAEEYLQERRCGLENFKASYHQ